jgi:hypothetical protein
MRVWLSRLVLLLALAWAAPAPAHPGWGIVQDSHGNIYYTDLAQVWRVAPDGTRTIAVPGVHTHELYLDAEDNLYGEHLWYEGEETDRWGYRVWRRAPDGTIRDVVPATVGFRTWLSFVRDRAGNMYWNDNGLVRRHAPGGGDTPVSPRRFADIRSMTVSPAGDVYLISEGALIRIGADGAVRTLAEHLGESNPALPFVGEQHQLMGLWLDRAGNAYVAVYGNFKVKRIDPQGRVETVARSTFPWSPSGGFVAPDGRLWLLEYSVTNQARIRMVDGPVPGRLVPVLPLFGAGGLALVGLAAFVLVRRRRRAN